MIRRAVTTAPDVKTALHQRVCPVQTATEQARGPSAGPAGLMPERSLLPEDRSGKPSIERVQIGLSIPHHPFRVTQFLLETLHAAL
jgi:hypothetical protein